MGKTTLTDDPLEAYALAYMDGDYKRMQEARSLLHQQVIEGRIKELEGLEFEEPESDEPCVTVSVVQDRIATLKGKRI